MQIKRHIALLLFFCFTVYLGHNLVPHCHHAEAPASPDTSACPTGHHNHADEHTGSMHCHAFNNIDFVKDSRTGLPGPVSVHTHFLMADPGSEPDPVVEAECAHLFSSKIPIRSTQWAGPPSLRAPPSQFI